jgi:hypothetical protein
LLALIGNIWLLFMLILKHGMDICYPYNFVIATQMVIKVS